MESQNEIRCPKCNSNQLTAGKKGFSGKKAVVGGLLTGGIGLLAGTAGMNKVKITCLACGTQFKPGEGKTTSSELKESKKVVVQEKPVVSMEDELLQILDEGLVRGAVYHYRTKQKVSKQDAIDYVEQFIIDHKLANSVKRKGCFVATACYEDFNAPEVLVLRNFRDEKLTNYFLGIIFVKVYYAISPFLAKGISKSEILKKSIRLYFLGPIVSKIQQYEGGKK